ncbi:DNA replication and repair protein RecF [Candidatus Terasakiella magnetica]|uniref:DNA replication and repair protein RecF n=2 Tax=Candidatus Terasakiella magnetica TaxID=1867952 RepID=A0A1C3RI81_9PROT|nr:DNA replication/repair protein RecF [Candidatus Terasakiella magnetica]SCA56979.1 DNA replication and repair protein RecF [Candidatus Terasakiella magnetica]
MAVPINITRLTLSNFRCYDFQRLDLDPTPVVLSGNNGAGKTNILEAVSLLAPGRGMRRAKAIELARRDEGCDEDSGRAWGVAATVNTTGGPVDIGTGREETGKKSGTRERRVVRIEGESARGQSALADYVDVVWLLPQMDRLFLDGAIARRRFLDRLVFGFDPKHASRMNAYEHGLRERAKLLKTGRNDDRWLSGLEEQMATKAVAVAAARKDIGQRLNILAVEGYGPFPGARLTPTGMVENWLDEFSALEVEDKFRAFLAEHRALDAQVGGAKDGVHKSDLLVRHVPKDQPAEVCSTGEQKALLTGMVLANTKALALDRGRIPLLLLDEVGAHLDEDRRKALFEAICAMGAQAWMTGTDRDMFKPFGSRANFFDVEKAAVVRVNE